MGLLDVVWVAVACCLLFLFDLSCVGLLFMVIFGLFNGIIDYVGGLLHTVCCLF